MTRSLALVSTMLVLALGGCNNPPRLVDAYVPPSDMGAGTDTNITPGTDANVHNDTNSTGTDSGGSGGCRTYGGGCTLTIGAGATDSCPMMGTTRQGCYPGNMMTQCAQAGSAQAGMTCSNLNDCDDGLICLATNTCARLCCATADCNPGEMCNPINGLPTGVTTGVCIHPTTCTIIPNSCPMGQQCYVVAMDGTTDCRPTGTGTEGMPFGGATGGGCVAGLGCYGTTMTNAMCTRFCRQGMDADCTGSAHTCGNSLGGNMWGLCM